MRNTKKTIFIFSLPRAGSTLLQKILMSHNDIASVAEPWILLPFIYATKKEGVFTEYSHGTFYKAFKDFISNFPGKEKDYNVALREFTLNLYDKLGDDKKYFLDKTPRYHLIIEEIAKIFPDSKFIFLFRNPIQILASTITTFGKGRLNRLYESHIDLYKGTNNLSNGYTLLKNKSLSIQYENLVSSPKREIMKIFEYLELEWDYSVLDNFKKQDLKGYMGDTVGVKEYNNIVTINIEKWKKVFHNPIRKYFLRNYILKIDEEVLAVQGYNKLTILEEIDNIKYNYRNIIQDSIDLIYSYLVRILKAYMFFGKDVKWARGIHLR